MAHADELVRRYYAEIERLYPILPDTIIVDPDVPRGAFGIAYYGGLRICDPADGHLHFVGVLEDDRCPVFSVREDVVITPRVMAHEAGHALEQVLFRRGLDPLALYWSLRAFPGTWEQMQRLATVAVQTNTYRGWQLYPAESFAEAFGFVAADEHQEQTENYGRPLDVAAAARFFASFGEEEVVTENEVRRIAGEVADEKLAVYAKGAAYTAEELRRKIEELAARGATPHEHTASVVLR